MAYEKAKNWKDSKLRILISGDIVEVYSYEKPYKYDGYASNRSYDRNNTLRRSDALGRAQAQIRRRIWSNVTESFIPRFYTFTFKEPIDNLQEANRAWGQFRRRLKRAVPDIQYVSVVEFQNKRKEKYGIGAWHYHCLFFNMPDVFHENELKAYKSRLSGIEKYGLIFDLWGNGFVDVSPTKTKITAIRSVASYVSKYLSKDTFDKRLNGQKVFFCSQGLKQTTEWHEQEIKVDAVEHLQKQSDLIYSGEFTTSKNGVVVYKQFKLKNYGDKTKSNDSKS